MELNKKQKGINPIVITPPASLELPNFREFWEYRGLFFFLVRRDIKLRFQQTFIGFFWVVLQPLIQMLIFYVILGILIKVPTNGIPYHLFFLSAFVVWQFFSQVVNMSAFSLVGNIGVILKSYFPRLALPISSTVNALVDFGVGFLVLLVFLLIDGHFPITSRYLLLPILVIITIIFSSGVGLLFGALMVVFRDTKNLLSFILLIWMYITPIIFPISIVPEQYRILFYFNPLTSLVDAYRWVFLGQGNLPKVSYLSISILVATIIWLCGAIAFPRHGKQNRRCHVNMSPLAIKAENIWKEYHIRHSIEGPQRSFKAVLNAPFERLTRGSNENPHYQKSEAFFALKEVSFEVEDGESIGLMGRNGTGKSTLLKILSRITRPSRGRITLYQRVNSLLEVGTGFNTDLSGRENIYLNGSFLGMKTSEIRQKFDEIVAFSEVEQFIDTPVKYYSSGMFVRLAFSVAVHLTPEILLLDEVLSVGDAGFQRKSFEKMKELLGGGATIILVSHNPQVIQDICKPRNLAG